MGGYSSRPKIKSEDIQMKRNTQNKPEIFGTKEWAAHTVNCCTGCSHDCKYCYARSIAVRFNRVRPENWKDEKIRPWDVSKRYRHMEGTVMFPSSHDISENNFLECFTVLTKLLEAGNRVLVVSKPHLRCISKICDDLQAYKNKILFRFTITACDDRILSIWEPGAPCYEERKESLKYAFNAGYKTSVSVEPMLDSDNIDVLIADLSPFVTESIWIGKMNQIRRRVSIDDERIEEDVKRIESGQTDERIWMIYEKYKNNRLIKWKESIKKVVEIELPAQAGMDI